MATKQVTQTGIDFRANTIYRDKKEQQIVAAEKDLTAYGNFPEQINKQDQQIEQPGEILAMFETGKNYTELMGQTQDRKPF